VTDPTVEKRLLDELASWVKNQGGQQKDRSAPWSWVTGLLIAAIAMLVIGFFYWRAWRQGKKIAKLLHEKDVAKEKALQADVDAKIGRTNLEAAKRRRAASKAWLEAQRLEEELNKARKAETRTTEEISALKNWRDIDRHLADGGDGDG
jgi:hypothetical protein